MKKNRAEWKFAHEQIFHPTFSGSSNTVFMLDRFNPSFTQHFIPVPLLHMLKLWISNDSTKTHIIKTLIISVKDFFSEERWFILQNWCSLFSASKMQLSKFQQNN